MRKLLIALVVLVALFATADRVAVALAEDQVGSRAQAAYALPARPDVSITGFPFLTQAVAGTYQQVDVAASSITTDGLTLRRLRVSLRDVRAPLSQLLGHGAAHVTAASASGSALVRYADVRRLLPSGLRLAVDGSRLKVSGTADILGTRTPVTALVALAVTSAGIQVTPTDVVVSPGVSLPVGSLGSAFGFVIPVRSLPMGLTLTSAKVTPSGLLVGAAARNVRLALA